MTLSSFLSLSFALVMTPEDLVLVALSFTYFFNGSFKRGKNRVFFPPGVIMPVYSDWAISFWTISVGGVAVQLPHCILGI